MSESKSCCRPALHLDGGISGPLAEDFSGSTFLFQPHSLEDVYFIVAPDASDVREGSSARAGLAEAPRSQGKDVYDVNSRTREIVLSLRGHNYWIVTHLSCWRSVVTTRTCCYNRKYYGRVGAHLALSIPNCIRFAVDTISSLRLSSEVYGLCGPA